MCYTFAAIDDEALFQLQVSVRILLLTDVKRRSDVKDVERNRQAKWIRELTS